MFVAINHAKLAIRRLYKMKRARPLASLLGADIGQVVLIVEIKMPPILGPDAKGRWYRGCRRRFNLRFIWIVVVVVRYVWLLLLLLKAGIAARRTARAS